MILNIDNLFKNYRKYQKMFGERAICCYKNNITMGFFFFKYITKVHLGNYGKSNM